LRVDSPYSFVVGMKGLCQLLLCSQLENRSHDAYSGGQSNRCAVISAWRQTVPNDGRGACPWSCDHTLRLVSGADARGPTGSLGSRLLCWKALARRVMENLTGACGRAHTSWTAERATQGAHRSPKERPRRDRAHRTRPAPGRHPSDERWPAAPHPIQEI